MTKIISALCNGCGRRRFLFSDAGICDGCLLSVMKMVTLHTDTGTVGATTRALLAEIRAGGVSFSALREAMRQAVAANLRETGGKNPNQNKRRGFPSDAAP